MTTITIESLHDTNRVTIPRCCMPETNITLTIAIIGSLTTANGPVINTGEYLVFNFDQRIPQSILYDFFKRWQINVDGMKKIN